MQFFIRHFRLALMLSALTLYNNAANSHQDPVYERIWRAIYKNDVETVSRLLSSGISVDILDEYGRTPLMTAAEYGREEIVRLLLDHGADVNARSENGVTPLLYASGKEATSIECLKLLLNAGANVNAATNITGSTPLIRAVGTGKTEAIKLLIAYGAAVNSQTNNGTTALMRVYDLPDKSNNLRLLLEAKADINIRDNQGFTALMRAIFYGRLAQAITLIEHGANVNMVSKYGDTALSIAKEVNHGKPVIGLLIKAGAIE